MEYLDQVLKHIQDAKPGTKVAVFKFLKPTKYIGTVKQLMDDGTLHHSQIEFTSDYKYLKILEPDILNFKKHHENNKRLWTLYQQLKNSLSARTVMDRKERGALNSVGQYKNPLKKPAKNVEVMAACGRLQL